MKILIILLDQFVNFQYLKIITQVNKKKVFSIGCATYAFHCSFATEHKSKVKIRGQITKKKMEKNLKKRKNLRSNNSSA